MQPFISSGPGRRHVCSAFLLILFMGSNARGAGGSIPARGFSRDLAFARYVTSQEQRDTFSKSATVGILIEASLPDLYKSAALLAVRTQPENGQSELHFLQIAGDGTVAEEVIDRYFVLCEQIDELPLSSIAITPANYKFHFAGEVKTGAGKAYVYDITPKKNQPGLVAGQLWMDSDTGHEVMLAGHLLHISAMGRRVDIVRDTEVINGCVCGRITHVTFALPRLGRAQLVIREMVMNSQITPQLE